MKCARFVTSFAVALAGAAALVAPDGTTSPRVNALGAAFAAPLPAPEQIVWARGLPAAQAEALQRKVPLLVVLNMDRERGNDAMVAEVYTAPAVREAAKRCVATIASIGKHAEALDPRAGRAACGRFGSVTCAEHQATEEVVRRDWLKKGPKDDVDSPRHILCAPDGRLLFERVWTLEAAELVRLIDRAVIACVPETLAAWDTVEARLARVAEPLECVRLSALRDLLAPHDAAVDAKLFDLVRKSENEALVRDVVGAMARDMTPSRDEGIRKLLAAPSAPVRMEAAAAVASGRAKDAFDVLLAAFGREKHQDVRCVLLRALAVCGGDPAKARDVLLKHAKSGDAIFRTHAIAALAPWAKEDAVVDAVTKLPAHEKSPDQLRAAACWLLGLSGRSDLGFVMKAARESPGELLSITAKSATARLESGNADPRYMNLRRWFAPLSVGLQEGP